MNIAKIVAVLCAALISACSSPSVQQLYPLEGAPDWTDSSSTQQFLYVSAGPNPTNVTVFRVGTLKLVRTIPRIAGGRVYLDSLNNLYVEDALGSGTTIREYQAGSTKLLRTIPVSKFEPNIAVDSHGYLYLADAGGGILLFAPNSVTIMHVIRVGATGVNALLIDKNDRMYVANGQYGNGFVAIFDPGKRPGYPRLTRKLTGFRSPVALALGPGGNLFVANDKQVHVFRAGSLALLRTIDHLSYISTIAVDSVGRLYVTSLPWTRKGYRPGWISVFEPGKTRPQRRITNGINRVISTVTDQYNQLYAADQEVGDVTVYSPGGAKLLDTLKKGFSYPHYLAIGAK